MHSRVKTENPKCISVIPPLFIRLPVGNRAGKAQEEAGGNRNRGRLLCLPFAQPLAPPSNPRPAGEGLHRWLRKRILPKCNTIRLYPHARTTPRCWGIPPYPRSLVVAPLPFLLKRSEAAGCWAVPQGCCSPAGRRNGWLQLRGVLAPCPSPRRRVPRTPRHAPRTPTRSMSPGTAPQQSQFSASCWHSNNYYYVSEQANTHQFSN